MRQMEKVRRSIFNWLHIFLGRQSCRDGESSRVKKKWVSGSNHVDIAFENGAASKLEMSKGLA